MTGHSLWSMGQRGDEIEPGWLWVGRALERRVRSCGCFVAFQRKQGNKGFPNLRCKRRSADSALFWRCFETSGFSV